MEIRGHLKFRPVGQGLFATGRLEALNGIHSFDWVYDCGSESARQYLHREISRYCAGVTKRRHTSRVDVLFLSHFDRDHINGVDKLLDACRADNVVVPYAPLWRRLLIAFSQGVDTQSREIGFFLNPIAYLAGDGEEPRTGRIIFIPPGAGPSPDGLDSGAPEGQGTRDWKLQADVRNLDATIAGDELGDFLDNPSVSVVVAREGSTLRVAHLWEFVPYNDADIERPPGPFIRFATEVKHRLIAAATSEQRTRALAELRAIFDVQFGSTSYARNVVSLFVWAGARMHAVADWWAIASRHRGLIIQESWTRETTPSVLYTGDGFLNTDLRCRALRAALGKRRLRELGVLQVMHHGSRANWMPGLAARLHPMASVFCSDPAARYRHPHAEVLRDFWSFGAIQVDNQQAVCGHFVADV